MGGGHPAQSHIPVFVCLYIPLLGSGYALLALSAASGSVAEQVIHSVWANMWWEFSCREAVVYRVSLWGGPALEAWCMQAGETFFCGGIPPPYLFGLLPYFLTYLSFLSTAVSCLGLGWSQAVHECAHPCVRTVV